MKQLYLKETQMIIKTCKPLLPFIKGGNVGIQGIFK